MAAMRRTLVGLIVGFVLGVATFWVGVHLTGGWYTYMLASRDSGWLERMQTQNCEPFEVKDIMFIRCPRFR